MFSDHNEIKLEIKNKSIKISKYLKTNIHNPCIKKKLESILILYGN